MARAEAVQKMAGRGLAPWQVELTVRHLLRDLGADPSVTELADLCGLSRGHFAKAFKASLGLSPHRWLVHQRVFRAAEMLEQSGESVSAIALACGFSDQSHLTRMFHALVGASPADWRRQRRAGVAPPVAPVPRFVPLPGARP
jgi:transcriptional regulator GlxA family with amidase domain